MKTMSHCASILLVLSRAVAVIGAEEKDQQPSGRMDAEKNPCTVSLGLTVFYAGWQPLWQESGIKATYSGTSYDLKRGNWYFTPQISFILGDAWAITMSGSYGESLIKDNITFRSPMKAFLGNGLWILTADRINKKKIFVTTRADSVWGCSLPFPSSTTSPSVPRSLRLRSPGRSSTGNGAYS